MSRDFEHIANQPSTTTKAEGVEPSVFNYMTSLIGDKHLSDLQAHHLKATLESSYQLGQHDVEEATGEMAINLRDEVQQQMKLLRAVRKEFFFPNGQPRPDTEGSDIKGYLNSAIQLMNLLQKFDDALKTDKDVRAIEAAIDMGFEALADHPDNEIAGLFVEVVPAALVKAGIGKFKESQ